MKSVDQLIAIAEILGWKPDILMKDGSFIWDIKHPVSLRIWRGEPSENNLEIWGARPTGPKTYTVDCRLPNYIDNRAAFDELEKTLPKDLWIKYESELHRITGSYGFDFYTASLAQRREAWLKTYGKWKESNNHV